MCSSIVFINDVFVRDKDNGTIGSVNIALDLSRVKYIMQISNTIMISYYDSDNNLYISNGDNIRTLYDSIIAQYKTYKVK